jgi:hypothetical protein
MCIRQACTMVRHSLMAGFVPGRLSGWIPPELDPRSTAMTAQPVLFVLLFQQLIATQKFKGLDRLYERHHAAQR